MWDMVRWTEPGLQTVWPFILQCHMNLFTADRAAVTGVTATTALHTAITPGTPHI